VEDYTPVNEPLTTARFAALYGHWYPHHRDALSFARALLIQCKAVVLAMRAIREVVPDARLVQTDDLGKTHSTPALAYQAAFENERRWLSFDLLTGCLTPDRPMWGWLREVGVPGADLAWFLDNPCPPDVVGINHYLSSERFLDERVDRYPSETPGGNGRDTYVDVLAARTLAGGAAGPEVLIGEAWDRYRLPIAITEAHNGCTREEQLRWLDEVWRAAEGARRSGADVRAVTVWSLLGAYDWNHMVTRDDGHYEPGVFDLRAPAPRPTAIARMVRDLGTEGRHRHPTLDVPGWWRRPGRLIYGMTETGAPTELAPRPLTEAWPDAAPLLLVGDGGVLGRAFGRACEHRHIPYRVVDRREQLADPAAAAEALAGLRPWAVVDLGAADRRRGDGLGAPACPQATVYGMASFAVATADAGIPLVAFSTDRVFDGRAGAPYMESDPITPGDPAGERQAAAERRVLAVHPEALVVRIGPIFGGQGEQDVVASVLRAGEPRPDGAPGDEVVSLSYAPDVAEVALDLLIDGDRGIWHLTNPGGVTWADVGRKAAGLAGLGRRSLIREPATAAGRASRRCRALESTRGWLLPSLDDALARRVAECSRTSRAPGATSRSRCRFKRRECATRHGRSGRRAVIEIRESKVYRGPNTWARVPVIKLLVDIGELEDRPSSAIPGFADRLVDLLPSLESTSARAATGAASSSACTRGPGWGTCWSTSPSTSRPSRARRSTAARPARPTGAGSTTSSTPTGRRTSGSPPGSSPPACSTTWSTTSSRSSTSRASSRSG
jgi:dTDP-4-dehydrorhamnose reductase